MLDSAAMTRADRNRNPAAFTYALAQEAKTLIEGVDYRRGDQFAADPTEFTAYILGDPVDVTRRLIDELTFYTHAGTPRWAYISMPMWAWRALDPNDVICTMYKRETGIAMRSLFSNYNTLSIL